MNSFACLASHFSQKKREAEAAELAARREEARRRQEEKVVGGVYRPEPVNKEAAMLLAKAPWFFHPPQEHPIFEKNNKEGTIENENTPVSIQQKKQVSKTPNSKWIPENGSPIESKKKQQTRKICNMKNETELITDENNNEQYMVFGSHRVFAKNNAFCKQEIAEAVIKYFEDKAQEEPCRVARALLDSRKAISDGIAGVAEIADKYTLLIRDVIENVRMARMTTVSEISLTLNALRDIRQFFIGPNYETETKRLAEFVGLCERLKSLKDSGFLDTVADTMIRLASSGGATNDH